MGLFRRSEAANLIPADTPSLMERFGRHEIDPQASIDDPWLVWSETQQPFLDFASNNPEGFLDSLAHAVVPLGGWAVYGAEHTVFNLLTEEFRLGKSFDAIMGGAVDFLRTNGVPPMRVTGYEWEHWLASGGTVDSWVERGSIPSIEEAPISDLGVGETRRITQLTEDLDSNAILVRRDGERYCALIDARWSDENPTRSQSEWKFSESIYGLYIDIGLSLQSPTYWCDPELEPYFPLPPPAI